MSNRLHNNYNRLYTWENRVQFDDFADEYLSGLLYYVCHGDSTLKDWPETRDKLKGIVQCYSDEVKKMSGSIRLAHILSCCHLNNEALESLAYSEIYGDKVLESHNSPLFLRMYLLAGDLYGRTGDYQKAQNSLDNAERILKKQEKKDIRAMSWLLANQGHLHLEQENYKKAQQCYNQSLQSRNKLEDPRLSALITYDLAELSFQRKRYNVCEDYLMQAGMYSKQFSENFYLAGMIKCKWAEIFSREEEYHPALDERIDGKVS